METIEINQPEMIAVLDPNGRTVFVTHGKNYQDRSLIVRTLADVIRRQNPPEWCADKTDEDLFKIGLEQGCTLLRCCMVVLEEVEL